MTMQQIRLVTSPRVPAAVVEALAPFGEVRRDGGQDEILEGAAVYVSMAFDPVSRAMIERWPESLRLLANIGVGIDNIDLDAARQRGIEVSNTPVVTEDTADLTLALLLATCRQVARYDRLTRRDGFEAAQQTLGRRVHGMTLGIVGFGEIGQAVARRARGFGMPLLYHGPRRKADAERALDARYCETLEELLAAADVVSLNCPLNDATRHLIDADALACMKPGSVLINTSRGAVVDEAALVAALERGQLGGAGLDVFEHEPDIHPALFDFDNVTLLPHVGSATVACRRDMMQRVVDNVATWLETGRALDSCT